MASALSTPLGFTDGPAKKTPHQRKRWLKTNIVGPARKLLAALSDSNSPMLSEWPEKMVAPAPDRTQLVGQLAALGERVEELIAQLDDRKSDGSDFNTEFRTDLANALTEIFEEYFPDLTAARSGYDKTSLTQSPYASFMRLCSEEIFPNDRGLSGGLIDEVSRLRGSR
jgi:hypothetical protein